MRGAGPKSAVLLLMTLFFAVAANAGGLRVFGPTDMRAIETEHAGEQFIVAIWSTDCPPCRRELSLLGTFSADHPNVPVVLIAIDTPDNTEAVRGVLASFELPRADFWLFGDAGAERLRYTIDPEWRGEMPRIYLYGEDGGRLGISGPISAALLERWLKGANTDTGR